MRAFEQTYTSSVGICHRKKFAQFFTPEIVADFMRNWILNGKNCNEIFDPAFGLGAFYSKCPNEILFSGMDIDPDIIDFYQTTYPEATVKLRQDNYLLNYSEKYENIICNPPYLKFQRFAQKELIFSKILEHYQIKLSGYTNIASAFLVKSILELKTGGRLAYLMPSEFLNTGYGAKVKELIVAKRFLKAIIRIECEADVFPDVTTSVCIILYDSNSVHQNLAFYSVNSISQLSGILENTPVASIPYSDLIPEEKWETFFTPQNEKTIHNLDKLTKLTTYGHFSRGIATGANSFFVLKKSKIEKLGLNADEYIPCITKSAQISKPIFTNHDFDILAESDSPVYLFDASAPISSAAQNYIQYGVENGYDAGYITQNRSPWYKMEFREKSPILLNVFSRQEYKVVRNMSDVLSLTSFHCFYPNLFGINRTNLLFLYLFSDVGHEILAYSMRKYGNNLKKFEPNDLNNALVPSEAFFDSIPTIKVKELMDKLLQGIDVKSDVNALFLPLIE